MCPHSKPFIRLCSRQHRSKRKKSRKVSEWGVLCRHVELTLKRKHKCGCAATAQSLSIQQESAVLETCAAQCAGQCESKRSRPCHFDARTANPNSLHAGLASGVTSDNINRHATRFQRATVAPHPRPMLASHCQGDNHLAQQTPRGNTTIQIPHDRPWRRAT